jgi:hypothetical protein
VTSCIQCKSFLNPKCNVSAVRPSFLVSLTREEVRVMKSKIKLLLLVALATALLALPQVVAYAGPIPCNGC